MLVMLQVSDSSQPYDTRAIMYQTRGVEDLRVHQRIALRAHELGYLELSVMCQALLIIGQHSKPPQKDLWTLRGWLSDEQLQNVLDVLANETLDTPTIPIPDHFGEVSDYSLIPESTRPQMRALFAEAQEESQSHHTLMTLPTAIFRRRTDSGDHLKFAQQQTSKNTPVSGLKRVVKTGACSTPDLNTTALSSDPFYDRYEMGDLLGQGGGGRVIRAFDRVLGRQVAMKILRADAQSDPMLLQRFITEAQTTGRLAHPNIMPIYDFGTLPTGEVYYTMREVRNRSLRSVLMELKAEGRAKRSAQNTDDPEDYDILRLVLILQQMCQAIHYAHAQGIVHRDLKPDNIMLGLYGEVLVVDWGLAGELDQGTDNTKRKESSGHTLGTPSYMPPEQARGELGQVDHQSDVYSLGAILYEMLTLQAPYRADSPLEIMWRVVDGDLVPPSKLIPRRDMPEELEQICLRAMAYAKHLRFPSAKAMHDALAKWIAGIQPREALERVIEGHAFTQRFRILQGEINALRLHVQQRKARLNGWEDISQKLELWSLEDQLKATTLESAESFGQAVANFTQARALDPDNMEARQGLAELYWMRFVQAEEDDDITSVIYFKALVERYDHEGFYAHKMREDVNLSLDVRGEVNTTSIKLISWVETQRRLILGDAQQLDALPCDVKNVNAGRYLLQLDRGVGEPLLYPLDIERGKDLRVTIHLPRTPCHPGFAFIPGGAYTSGGDVSAFDPKPKEIVHVDSFFLAAYPVTFREYLAWLDDIHPLDAAETQRRAPQIRGSDGMLASFDANLGRWVPEDILIEGPLRNLYPIGEGYEWDLPVVGVGHADALEYIKWRTIRDGVHYRLPSEDELEKAGRGVDGRLFPWGDHFDPTFCRMRFSRQHLAQLEPVGTFDDDISPYGVRDLAGGVQDWCQALPDEPNIPLKGGSWNQDARACHLASRIRVFASSRSASIGFRLAYDDNE